MNFTPVVGPSRPIPTRLRSTHSVHCIPGDAADDEATGVRGIKANGPRVVLDGLVGFALALPSETPHAPSHHRTPAKPGRLTVSIMERTALRASPFLL